SELRVSQERTRGKLESQAKQIGSIENRLAQGENETTELQARAERHQQDVQNHLSAVAEIEAQVQSASERLSAKSAEREELNRARSCSARFNSSRSALLADNRSDADCTCASIST